MMTSKELGGHMHNAVATFASGLALLYTTGLIVGAVCFSLWDKYTPVLGLVPRQTPYKAPRSASKAPAPSSKPTTTKAPRKRPSRAKKVALATN